jgi:hypothetical protein
MFRAPCAHRQEVKIVLYNLWYHHTETCFTISLLYASTCFEHHVLIVRRSKLCYTASGIITPIGVMIPDDEHMVLETCTGMKQTHYKI